MLNSTPDLRNKMVPLALHGDGTPFIGIGRIWSRQLTIFSFNSLLGRGVTKDMQYHVWSCFDECCGPTAMNVLQSSVLNCLDRRGSESTVATINKNQGVPYQPEPPQVSSCYLFLMKLYFFRGVNTRRVWCFDRIRVS